MYIMRRTQLYLDEALWKALQARSRESGRSVSDLVREAARDHYLIPPKKRAAAMRAIVGIWKDRDDLPSTETYVRRLRRGRRLQRVAQ